MAADDIVVRSDKIKFKKIQSLKNFISNFRIIPMAANWYSSPIFWYRRPILINTVRFW